MMFRNSVISNSTSFSHREDQIFLRLYCNYNGKRNVGQHNNIPNSLDTIYIYYRLTGWVTTDERLTVKLLRNPLDLTDLFHSAS